MRRIAEEETSRLTDQARAALGQEDEPWSALSRFLRTSVASGAGRLLPPHVLRVGVAEDGPQGPDSLLVDEARVPQQRYPSATELRLVEQRTPRSRTTPVRPRSSRSSVSSSSGLVARVNCGPTSPSPTCCW